MKKLALIPVLVALGCSEEYFPDAPKDDPPVASKPTVDYIPTISKDYDPYKDESIEQRKAGIGGDAGAEKYFQVVVDHLARSLRDKKVREIIHDNTPTWDKGEVQLSELVKHNPHLLKMMSNGFIQSVGDKGISGDLANTIHEDLFNGEALLQVAGALLDLEITLVNKWDGTKPIAVLYIPVDEESLVINGVDADLNPISWPVDGGIPPYPFLSVNFDEDQARESTTSITPEGNSWSFISPAYAHRPDGHPACYHYDAILPLREITVHDNHEPGDWNQPEIEIEIYYYDNSVSSKPRFILEDLNVIDSLYTEWNDERVHGTCYRKLDKIQVWEADTWSSDDNVAYWRDRTISQNQNIPLARNDADSEEKDATILMRGTSDDM